MCLLAETAGALRDRRRARDLYRLLLPYGERVAISYPEISVGAVAQYLGQLASLMDRVDDAARHFEDALELNARIGARPWLARTRHDLGAMLAAHATGDADRGTPRRPDAARPDAASRRSGP